MKNGLGVNLQGEDSLGRGNRLDRIDENYGKINLQVESPNFQQETGVLIKGINDFNNNVNDAIVGITKISNEKERIKKKEIEEINNQNRNIAKSDFELSMELDIESYEQEYKLNGRIEEDYLNEKRSSFNYSVDTNEFLTPDEKVILKNNYSEKSYKKMNDIEYKEVQKQKENILLNTKDSYFRSITNIRNKISMGYEVSKQEIASLDNLGRSLNKQDPKNYDAEFFYKAKEEIFIESLGSAINKEVSKAYTQLVNGQITKTQYDSFVAETKKNILSENGFLANEINSFGGVNIDSRMKIQRNLVSMVDSYDKEIESTTQSSMQNLKNKSIQTRSELYNDIYGVGSSTAKMLGEENNNGINSFVGASLSYVQTLSPEELEKNPEYIYFLQNPRDKSKSIDITYGILQDNINANLFSGNIEKNLKDISLSSTSPINVQNQVLGVVGVNSVKQYEKENGNKITDLMLLELSSKNIMPMIDIARASNDRTKDDLSLVGYENKKFSSKFRNPENRYYNNDSKISKEVFKTSMVSNGVVYFDTGKVENRYNIKNIKADEALNNQTFEFATIVANEYIEDKIKKGASAQDIQKEYSKKSIMYIVNEAGKKDIVIDYAKKLRTVYDKQNGIKTEKVGESFVSVPIDKDYKESLKKNNWVDVIKNLKVLTVDRDTGNVYGVDREPKANKNFLLENSSLIDSNYGNNIKKISVYTGDPTVKDALFEYKPAFINVDNKNKDLFYNLDSKETFYINDDGNAIPIINKSKEIEFIKNVEIDRFNIPKEYKSADGPIPIIDIEKEKIEIKKRRKKTELERKEKDKRDALSKEIIKKEEKEANERRNKIYGQANIFKIIGNKMRTYANKNVREYKEREYKERNKKQ